MAMPRVQRCGKCIGCKTKNCGECKFCLDIGGIMKKCCVRRQCIYVLERQLQRESSGRRRFKKGCDNCEGCSRPSCGLCLPCIDESMFGGIYLHRSLCVRKSCSKAVLSYPLEEGARKDAQIKSPVLKPAIKETVVKTVRVTEKCKFCDVQFHSVNALYRHINYRHFDTHFQCTLCGKSSKQAKETRNHVRKTHSYLNKILNNCVDAYVVKKGRLPSVDNRTWEYCVLPAKILAQDKNNLIQRAMAQIKSSKLPWAAEACPSCDYISHDLNGFKLHLSMSKDCLHFFHLLEVAERSGMQEEHNFCQNPSSKVVRLIFKSSSTKTTSQDFILPAGGGECSSTERSNNKDSDRSDGELSNGADTGLGQSSSSNVNNTVVMSNKKRRLSDISDDNDEDDVDDNDNDDDDYDYDYDDDDSAEVSKDLTNHKVRCLIDIGSKKNFDENPSATAYVSDVKPLNLFS